MTLFTILIACYIISPAFLTNFRILIFLLALFETKSILKFYLLDWLRFGEAFLALVMVCRLFELGENAAALFAVASALVFASVSGGHGSLEDAFVI